METRSAARRRATWERAWPAADVESIAALYAPEAVFFSHPFRVSQRLPTTPRGDSPIKGDRAAVDWWAVVTGHDEAVETLAGTSRLRFDRSGLVVEQRDVWS